MFGNFLNFEPLINIVYRFLFLVNNKFANLSHGVEENQATLRMMSTRRYASQ